MAKKIPSEISNPQSLRALMVDDSEDDVLLIIRELKKGGYNPVYERVETAAAMKKALQEKQWDLILCDYKMPSFNALSAIAILKETNKDIPLIIISGAIGEETAVECMRLGAQDYLMKGKLSRLCPAISRELEEVKGRNKQQQTESRRKDMLETLRQSEEKYRTILENMQESYYELDLNGNFTFVNNAVCRNMGYSKDELIGMNYRQYTDKEDLQRVFQAYSKVYLTGEPLEEFSWRIIKKDGTKMYIEGSASLKKDSEGKTIGFKGLHHDITKRKQMEEEIRQSEEKYRTFIETIQDGYYEIDLTGKYTFVNDVICDQLQYSKEELIGKSNRQYQTEANAKKAYEVFTEVIITGNPVRAFEMEVIRKDGSIQLSEVSISLIRDTNGNPIAFRGTSRDITERKRIEEELRQSEEKYRTILENIEDGYYETDLAGNLTFFNDSLCRLYGYSKEELMGMNNQQYADKETSKEVFQAFNKVYSTGEPTKELNWQAIRKDGTKRYVEASASLKKDSSGKPIGFRGIIRDITERKQAEQQLKESEKYFKEITENSSDVIIITDKNGDIKYCSRSIERFTGYNPEEIIGRSAFAFIHPDDVERAASDYGKAILSIDSAIPNALRIVRKDGSERYFAGLGRNLLDNPAVAGFVMNIRDITESKQTEEKLLQTLESLRKAFGTTIQVMVSAVEIRDPYTAGHQIRSADIARSIAKEMGLSQDRIDGIRMAGSIHDIGKLSIPSEILSKPTKLTNIEFSMIKEHPQSGYEMLKDIESPWPLAQIVYQHHERMDGSGYPRNLKGDEIILEARIMAVADVVEAMASHRPYRSALGIDAALEEIEKNKGTLYDNTVADACLRLFREKGYKLIT